MVDDNDRCKKAIRSTTMNTKQEIFQKIENIELYITEEYFVQRKLRDCNGKIHNQFKRKWKRRKCRRRSNPRTNRISQETQNAM